MDGGRVLGNKIQKIVRSLWYCRTGEFFGEKKKREGGPILDRGFYCVCGWRRRYPPMHTLLCVGAYR